MNEQHDITAKKWKEIGNRESRKERRRGGGEGQKGRKKQEKIQVIYREALNIALGVMGFGVR